MKKISETQLEEMILKAAYESENSDLLKELREISQNIDQDPEYQKEYEAELRRNKRGILIKKLSIATAAAAVLVIAIMLLTVHNQPTTMQNLAMEYRAQISYNDNAIHRGGPESDMSGELMLEKAKKYLNTGDSLESVPRILETLATDPNLNNNCKHQALYLEALYIMSQNGSKESAIEKLRHAAQAQNPYRQKALELISILEQK